MNELNELFDFKAELIDTFSKYKKEATDAVENYLNGHLKGKSIRFYVMDNGSFSILVGDVDNIIVLDEKHIQITLTTGNSYIPHSTFGVEVIK